jgi:hypothetical protein
MAKRKPFVPIVNSVSAFLTAVSKLSEEWLPREEEHVGPWFRGQQNAEWRLLPKLYRQLTS